MMDLSRRAFLGATAATAVGVSGCTTTRSRERSLNEAIDEFSEVVRDDVYVSREPAEGYAPDEQNYVLRVGRTDTTLLNPVLCREGQTADRNDVILDMKDDGIGDFNPAYDLVNETYDRFRDYTPVKRGPEEERITDFSFRWEGVGGEVVYDVDWATLHGFEVEDEDYLNPVDFDRFWTHFRDNFEIYCDA